MKHWWTDTHAHYVFFYAQRLHELLTLDYSVINVRFLCSWYQERMTDVQNGFPLGPQPGITYPIRVLYCGNCSLPIEVSIIKGPCWIFKNLALICVYLWDNISPCLLQYCEYYPEYEKCKLWLERNLPTEFERVVKLGKYTVHNINIF